MAAVCCVRGQQRSLQWELKEDDKVRANHDDEFRSCRDDYLKLRRALQTKLQSAVDSGAVLGLIPPAHETEQ